MTPPATDRDAALEPWFEAARADLAARHAPPWIESALRARAEERQLLRSLRQAADRTRPPAQPAGRGLWWLGVPVVAAAALLLAIGLPALTAPPAPSDPSAAAFMALAPLDEIAAERSAVLVPGIVPRAQLAEYGLPVDPARADQPAHAEFLLSPRGAVLAVRFVQ